MSDYADVIAKWILSTKVGAELVERTVQSALVKSIEAIAPDENLIIVVRESITQSELDELDAAIVEIIPRNRFAIISSDNPLNIVRIQ
jgi:hypothetical protein